jgi:hypothetical protein
VLVEQLPLDALITCTPNDDNPSAVGTTCNVSCQTPGFSGNSAFTCIGNDTWVGCALICAPASCPEFHPEGEKDEERLENCTGPHVVGDSCRIACRGKFQYCGMDSAELDCVGVSPGVAAWQGNPNCCKRPKRPHKKHRERDRDEPKERERERDRDESKERERDRDEPKEREGDRDEREGREREHREPRERRNDGDEDPRREPERNRGEHERDSERGRDRGEERSRPERRRKRPERV